MENETWKLMIEAKWLILNFIEKLGRDVRVEKINWVHIWVWEEIPNENRKKIIQVIYDMWKEWIFAFWSLWKKYKLQKRTNLQHIRIAFEF